MERTTVSDWKYSERIYKFLYGLWVDFYHLMSVQTSWDECEILKLAFRKAEGSLKRKNHELAGKYYN